jgi:transcriptional activator SPT8
MAPSDSEDDNLEDIEYEGDDDPDAEVDDELLDVVPDDATEEADDVCFSLHLHIGADCIVLSVSKFSASDDSDDGTDDDEDEDSEPPGGAAMDVDFVPPPPGTSKLSPPSPPSQLDSKQPLEFKNAVPLNCLPQIAAIPSVPRKRSLSPAQLRKTALTSSSGSLRTCTVEAICALPHPVPTHALASSFCMTHLLTGSDDGYIRDYDVFSAVNGKGVLSAPQRSHSGVVEGTMKAGQLRFWWENLAAPAISIPSDATLKEEDQALSPVYSLAMHSDALWALAGTDVRSTSCRSILG